MNQSVDFQAWANGPRAQSGYVPNPTDSWEQAGGAPPRKSVDDAFEDSLTMFSMHRRLLADRARTTCFQRAIEGVVRPGDSVVDLGAGSGILGLFACRAGARQVVAIDRGPFEPLVRGLYAENGFADRLVWIGKDSLEVELDQRVDVLLAEILGNFAVEEAMLCYFLDARRRFLKPGGRLMPEKVRLFVAPTRTDAPALPETRGPLAGSARNAMRETCWAVDVAPSDLLGEPVLLSELDLARAQPGHRVAGKAVLRIAADAAGDAASVAGIAGWFEADLGDGIVLSTAPWEPATHWRQVLFPLPEARSLAPGSEVVFSLRGLQLEANTVWSWSAVTPAEGERWRCGNPARTQLPGERRLRLTRAGEEELELLRRFGEGASFEELMSFLLERDPDHYASAYAAHRRVSAMLRRSVR
ncbi:MAG: hypothetical protein GY711_06100 [bacterium]|nr:hypothetical protein [bacterium]